MIIGLCLSCTALSLALFRDFVVHSYTVLFSCVQNIPHFNIGGGTGFCKTDTRLSQIGTFLVSTTGLRSKKHEKITDSVANALQ
ncbi:hypothetical protein NSK_004421 [Nannochloropsis salina CCMP1776]|uniref:Secreted protein n=1 Tax=Nannochloropsis salina CCMP1776 TaxID=1027361 RepID=A0A4D9CZG8_9STRA|nr:hypothetical protein NSK_004421 [Nannochloropsis salina CCMP1776]|eukprot:TFJ84436.1 hypothetical protein NSK_004421 [Nannochloropsis salina CCMP1776]